GAFYLRHRNSPEVSGGYSRGAAAVGSDQRKCHCRGPGVQCMTYIENVIVNYVTEFVTGREGLMGAPVKIVARAKFNPNLKSSWFTSVMQVINNLTMLTVILTGAALIREREQGTVEHLLVMPVVPAEIMLSKILANGLVILAAAELSLLLVVQWWLQVPIAG